MERPTWAGAKVLPLHWKPTDDEDGGHDDDEGEGGLDEGDDDAPQEVEGLAGCWVPRNRLSTGAKTVRATGAACRFGSNSVFNLNKKTNKKKRKLEVMEASTLSTEAKEGKSSSFLYESGVQTEAWSSRVAQPERPSALPSESHIYKKGIYLVPTHTHATEGEPNVEVFRRSTHTWSARA